MNVKELFNFFKSSPTDMFDFREEGRKGERDRNIHMREKH